MTNTVRVVKVLDANIVEIFPPWELGDYMGTLVRIAGYNGPSFGRPGYDAALVRLRGLVFGKDVTLEDHTSLRDTYLVSKVCIDGIDVSVFFPEYR